MKERINELFAKMDEFIVGEVEGKEQGRKQEIFAELSYLFLTTAYEIMLLNKVDAQTSLDFQRQALTDAVKRIGDLAMGHGLAPVVNKEKLN